MITRRISRPFGALAKESWVCPSCTRASIIPQQQQQRRALSATAPRHRITSPNLFFHKEFYERGVVHLFSADGYKLGWVNYQASVIQKLNELLAGDPDENSDVKSLVLKYARDPMSASIFNHASMAWNNHFFYSALSTAPQELDKVTGGLEASLTNSFGSIDTLQTTMLDTAASMFAPGFVWLVWARDIPGPTPSARRGGWRILSTYAAGTPFPEAGYRQQGIDANTNNAESYNNYVGAFGALSRHGQNQARLPPGGTNVMPVLCVNTWEHVWIYDYGITGKRQYLSDWWNAVNWAEVERRAPPEAKLMTPRFQDSESRVRRAG